MVKDFIKKIRERAIGHEVIDTLNPAQQIIKIVNEELTEVLGSDTAEIIKSPKIPTIIMMVGLQGAGKTTFAGKLANKLKKEEDARPLMIAADIYRPAAIDQLKTLGQQIDVPDLLLLELKFLQLRLFAKVWSKLKPTIMTIVLIDDGRSFAN